MTARVRDALPKHLQAKLVDVVNVSISAPHSEVVESTIAAYIEAEEKESHAIAESLVGQSISGGLAVVGAEATFRALKRGQVDTLVLMRDYSTGHSWACATCEYVYLGREKPVSCPECGSPDFRVFNIKEEMVRLAEGQGCGVEVVDESKALTQLGGVGCLLRFRLPEEYV